LLAGASSARFAVVACVRTTVEQDPNGTGISAIPRSVVPMREAVLRLQELPKSLTAAFRDFANNIQPVGTRIAQMFSALFDVVAQPERRNSNSPKRTEEVNQHMTDKPKKKPRGFATLTPERRAEIARQGGLAAHANGKAHRFTIEEAKAAGRKGGLAAHEKGTAHEFTAEEASAAGKKSSASKKAGKQKEK
jgi:general stress protein YciG